MVDITSNPTDKTITHVDPTGPTPQEETALNEGLPIPGPKVILLGDSGTGKTFVLQTLLEAGVTPFIIFTEPGMETLGKKILDQCHWRYIPPMSQSFSGLSNLASMITKTDFDGVSKMRDANKPFYTAIIDTINQCNNFVDQYGKSFGDCSTWQTDRALVVDSLSGLSDMASQMIVGGKPLKSQGEWQVAQNMLKFLIDKLTTGLTCSFVLTSHIARERDELTGGSHLTVSTLGRALAPELPKYFSDIIHCDRTGDRFTWDTTKTGMVLKARNVPLRPGIQPSFKPLFEAWKARGGRIIKTEDGSNSVVKTSASK